MMDAAQLKSFVERVDEARADYMLALGQIADDAKAGGLDPAEIVGDMVHRAWVKEKAKDPEGLIYFAKVEDLEIVKVGFSISVPDRMRALRTEHGRDFEVLGTVKGTMSDERWFHRMLWWCRDRTLKGNEFFSYPACRGLVRIFVANADRFPFDRKAKDATYAWVEASREKIAAKHKDHASAIAALGAAFELAASVHCPGGKP